MISRTEGIQIFSIHSDSRYSRQGKPLDARCCRHLLKNRMVEADAAAWEEHVHAIRGKSAQAVHGLKLAKVPVLDITLRRQCRRRGSRCNRSRKEEEGGSGAEAKMQSVGSG